MILGFLSDAHGNREAYDEGVAVLRGAGAEQLYFLGDAVGYLPGTAVIDAIRETDVAPLLGNHEDMLLAGSTPDDRDVIYRHRQTADDMPTADRDFVGGWPTSRQVDSASGPLLLVHGSPDDPLHGYVYPDTDLDRFAGTRNSAAAGFRAVFMGQTHRPFVRESGSTIFVNVGSCGLPRDCGNLGAAAIFDDQTATATILRFDITAATATALHRCGPVAPQVLSVFERRSTEPCFGEMYA